MELQRNFRLVCTTVSSKEKALELARGIIEQKLAFCCQISEGMQSIYRWNGTISEEIEYGLSCKTSIDLVYSLRDHIAAKHGYEIPGIIIIEAEFLHEQYMAWAMQSLR